MNYFKRKRIQKGFDQSDMANLLEIDYKKYVAIEKGERKMPVNLIDKFNKIIEKGKSEVQLDHLTREQQIEQWLEEMRQPTDDGIMLQTKMKEFNIDTYKQLANLIGYRSGSTVSTCMNPKKGRTVSYDFKNLLYSFFQNELNIQDKQSEFKIQPRKTKTTKIRYPQELADFYAKFNLEHWLDEANMSMNDFAKKCQVSVNTIYNYIGGKIAPTVTTLAKIKNVVNNYTQAEQIKQSQSENYISKQKLIEQCEQEIRQNDEKIETLQKQIKELQYKSDFAARFIDLVNSLD